MHKRCYSCDYGIKGPTSAVACCGYIMITGHSRRCPAGDKCTHFIPIGTLGRDLRRVWIDGLTLPGTPRTRPGGKTETGEDLPGQGGDEVEQSVHFQSD